MSLKSKLGPISAVAVASAAVLWMYSGGHGITHAQASDQQANETHSESKVDTPSSSTDTSLFSVQVKTLTAQSIENTLKLSGETESDKSQVLVNAIAGKVSELTVLKGDYVKAGQKLVAFDTRSLKANISQARALVKQRKIELDGIKRLKRNNLTSQVTLAQAETDLASAQATLKSYQINLENAIITAPFAGIVNTVNVEKGQYVAVGSGILDLVSVDPITVKVNLPQAHLSKVAVGTIADVALPNGTHASGQVEYVSRVANNATRTLPVEINLPNPDNNIPAGISADVNFILNEQKAHSFSPALISLNDAGKTSIKTIAPNNTVQSEQVEIVREERDKVWVIGLPNTINIITVGQGYVSVGDQVDVHFKN
ncbi:efflux RND transporter periplasmic adaptor subunit [Marinomonas mediterranea]|jgi:RND family efflux transporter, MFP subunit|uniref:Efflux transporter, RND family, MFP subunit n=1 Tax=Marinomonas mediterranea (strain ATCC 700492 / JCM 21426 / NBRC 103028 / MMB-1) TaxID=717774 RepID=F2K3Z1_MARM1|nr:efflux RND transporter periplasmic adaptor subunit [Marinomonas mediterranea]ADZ91333.1 efflux transporter, RND family, MFP subunit [Marinomonas mediterranea MMB-1]WCN09303.1 efflux RND transporter periplasmic adaptor subunit [Marinomonas mediterranea]WCN13385.1 efflux RND transporter periplasmic adaptor subunit [Marinomonas mediterranea]WCN17453.1 efflux RND transporter periplasmic adaptor subunit [Marinomonas mediterranea MMB-1]